MEKNITRLLGFTRSSRHRAWRFQGHGPFARPPSSRGRHAGSRRRPV